MTWKQFVSTFMNQFFPPIERDARREEFGQLVQGCLSVSLCESRFADLSRYAADLVATEGKKVRRFSRGLRPANQTLLAVLKLTDYRDVVDRALIMERGGVHREAAHAVREEGEQGRC